MGVLSATQGRTVIQQLLGLSFFRLTCSTKFMFFEPPLVMPYGWLDDLFFVVIGIIVLILLNVIYNKIVAPSFKVYTTATANMGSQISTFLITASTQSLPHLTYPPLPPSPPIFTACWKPCIYHRRVPGSWPWYCHRVCQEQGCYCDHCFSKARGSRQSCGISQGISPSISYRLLSMPLFFSPNPIPSPSIRLY